MACAYETQAIAFHNRLSTQWQRWLVEFIAFGTKEALACSFAGSFLLILAISKYISIPGIYRYDLLFYVAISIQIILITLRLENWREIAMLFLFHMLGTALELFKTSSSVGSWHYPEPSFWRIATVPLYSGFMYSAIGSYLIQAWRLLYVRVEKLPPLWVCGSLCFIIYANFFTNHWLTDIRVGLFMLVLITFWHTRVYFRPLQQERWLPLSLAFLLIGFFIWMAENICTWFGAWVYPHQLNGWAIVGTAKITSWALLVILSFLLVVIVKQIFPSLKQD